MDYGDNFWTQTMIIWFLCNCYELFLIIKSWVLHNVVSWFLNRKKWRGFVINLCVKLGSSSNNVDYF